MSHQGYQALSTKDVVFVEGLASSATLFKTDATLRVKDLLSKIEVICAASGQLSAEEVSILFGTGINCEILRPGATDWAQGKLQLNLGFQANGAPTSTASVVIPTPTKTVIIEPAIVPSPKNPIAPMPTATAAATAQIDRSSVSTKIDRSSVSTTRDRPSVATPRKADELPELDLASFTNAPLPDHDAIESLEEIDHSDVFSLMEDPEVTPLGDDFGFGDGLEGLEGLEFDAEPAAKSISSPWDLEELDSMLMAK